MSLGRLGGKLLFIIRGMFGIGGHCMIEMGILKGCCWPCLLATPRSRQGSRSVDVDGFYSRVIKYSSKDKAIKHEMNIE